MSIPAKTNACSFSHAQARGRHSLSHLSSGAACWHPTLIARASARDEESRALLTGRRWRAAEGLAPLHKLTTKTKMSVRNTASCSSNRTVAPAFWNISSSSFASVRGDSAGEVAPSIAPGLGPALSYLRHVPSSTVRVPFTIEPSGSAILQKQFDLAVDGVRLSPTQQQPDQLSYNTRDNRV